MERRRILENPLLPAGYKLLDRIVATGTQYLQFPCAITANRDFEVKFRIYGGGASNQSALGSYPNYQIISNYYSINNQTQAITYTSQVGGNSSNGGFNCIKNAYANVTITNSRMYIETFNADGTIYNINDKSVPRNITQNITDMRLFWSYDSIKTKISGLGFHNFIVTSDGSIIVALYSALRLLDNKPGMYDTINDVFYTNAGTGEFQYL